MKKLMTITGRRFFWSVALASFFSPIISVLILWGAGKILFPKQLKLQLMKKELVLMETASHTYRYNNLRNQYYLAIGNADSAAFHRRIADSAFATFTGHQRIYDSLQKLIH